ncbi:hypothetical protein [Burkholderia sp. IMCC1007]|uniref:hypothetical protein n=1 Tax=Burkholderia sp. IMCC1007 TaxID=3004104 RepID=UPI0022B4D079|nr:hypothetical protein [Burkholderia sp. IMCC1007]
MKIHKHLAALAACGALTGLAHAGPTSPQAVVKKITLTAHIGDSLFASKPDDSALNDVVELSATDRAPQIVGATLPIRVRTTGPDINVVLLQPMADTKIVLTDRAGSVDMVPGAGRAVRLMKRSHDGFDGYDETRDLTISAPAPAVHGTAAPSGGRYPARVVLVFEPAASAGREPAAAQVAVTEQ